MGNGEVIESVWLDFMEGTYGNTSMREGQKPLADDESLESV
jgi:hypothetical protein